MRPHHLGEGLLRGASQGLGHGRFGMPAAAHIVALQQLLLEGAVQIAPQQRAGQGGHERAGQAQPPAQ